MATTKLKQAAKKDRDPIIAQALREIMFARNYKQGKCRNWKINEDLYYSRKVAPVDSRSNVDLGQMQFYVHTILSKVDNPLIFKFKKRKMSQMRRVDRLNALRTYDQDRDDWDMKDLVGKKQACIYGRAIYSYYASSTNGYTPHLYNVDVYDFLIDPSAGGIDTDKAQYLGDYGVVYTRQELEEGIKSGEFLKEETQRLLDGSSNATEWPQEETNKINRTRDQNVWQVNKEISGSDKFKFWRWGTTYKGVRYYCIMTERAGLAVKIIPLTEMTKAVNEKTGQPMWWYWTYAAFPDLTEFWTPGWCDYVREIVMAKAVSVNQGLDNAEMVNKPQKVVNIGAVRNLSQLKYRREGFITVKKEFDATKAIQVLTVPPIETPVAMYKLLDDIQNSSSGVNPQTTGNDPNQPDEKATIYEGNQEASADLFGLFNKSYSHGYKRFGRMYEANVKEHLIKSVEIEILGPGGIELQDINKSMIFWKNDTFGLSVEGSNAELAMSAAKKDAKIKFLQAQAANMNGTPQNEKKAYELEAEAAGFTDEEIRELLDTSEMDSATMMSMADDDIEKILDGQKVKPNLAADNAYKQRIVDYMTTHAYDLSPVDFDALTAYVASLKTIIVKNMISLANRMAANKAVEAAMNAPTPSQPAPGGPGAGAPNAPVAPAPTGAPALPMAAPAGAPPGMPAGAGV